jgi:hypothetical protein
MSTERVTDGASGAAGGGSGGGDGGDGLPSPAEFLGITSEQLEWLRNLVANPRTTILGFVLGWVVEQVWGGATWLFNTILSTVTALANAVIGALEAAALPFTGLVTGTAGGVFAAHNSMIALVESAGIAALPAAMAVVFIEMFVAVFVVDALLRIGVFSLLSGIPIVGSVVSAIASLYAIVKSAFFRAYGVAVDG